LHHEKRAVLGRQASEAHLIGKHQGSGSSGLQHGALQILWRWLWQALACLQCLAQQRNRLCWLDDRQGLGQVNASLDAVGVVCGAAAKAS
jgi:hypothetical protein